MAMETVQVNLKVTNMAQFERITIRNLSKGFIPIRVRTVKCSGMLAPFRLLRATRISHSWNVVFFEYATDNLHLPINLLGLIVNGL